MISFVLLVALAQAPLTEPPPPPPPVVQQSPATPTPVQRSARLFSGPQVDGGTLVARMALGFLGTIGGATIGALFMGVAFVASNGLALAAPYLIASPFAAASMGFGTALGAGAFGTDYGSDLADAIVVGMVTSVIAVGLVIACLALFAQAALPVIIFSAFFPAVATPLFVQAFKKPADETGVVVARF